MAADRQDLDALLIGALYGELDGDERARLDAHLASHPQDRSALDGLRATRAMLRDADVAAYLGSAEPATAISARLLQEAARRAPARAAGGGVFAWLSSLLRPFVASPALSAATALVLVGGAAGVMYARGTFDTREPRAAGPTHSATAENDRASASLTPNAPAAAPAAVGGAPADDYRVSLEERQAGAGSAAADGDGLADQTVNEALAGKDRGNDFTFQPESPARAATSRKGTKAEPSKRPGYIALDPVKKDAPAMLDVDRAAGDDLAREEGEGKNVVAATGSTAADRNFGATLEGRAPTAPPGPAPIAPPSSTAPKTNQIARDSGKTGSAGNPAAAAALDAWARDQHARMIALVKKGSCTDAGAIGAEIVRRAPDYYAANVANDRQVRTCRSYVDRARRAKSEDSKTKAASPRAPAPDSQVDLESAH